MSDHLPDKWIRTVSTWAAAEPGVQRVYLYGSRVKGTAKPNSDLDIAVVAHVVGHETATTVGFYRAGEWGETLNQLLPVQVHLQPYDPAVDRARVGAGVTEHGICIFDRDLPSSRKIPTL